MGVNKSQAMSAFIKTIRMRREDEALIWLTQLQNLTDPYPILRRIVIAAGEDCNSLPVMEKVIVAHENYAMVGPLQMAAEVLRICRTTNWWAQESGRDWIYRFWEVDNHHKMVGMSFFKRLEAMALAVKVDDPYTAFMNFTNIEGSVGYSRKLLLSEMNALAEKYDRSGQALKTLQLIARAGSVLDHDGNWTGQVLHRYFLPLGDQDIQPVWKNQTIDRLHWAYTVPVNYCPPYYLDGVHVAGKDNRFGGIISSMRGMCLAYEDFGRLHQDDKWPSHFRDLATTNYKVYKGGKDG